MGSELEPCPFPNCTAGVMRGYIEDDSGEGYGYVECKSSEHFSGVHRHSEEEAVNTWNARVRRPDAPAPDGVSRDPVKEKLAEALRRWRVVAQESIAINLASSLIQTKSQFLNAPTKPSLPTIRSAGNETW